MADNERVKDQEDEIILSAEYSPFKVWFSIPLVVIFPMVLIVGGAYFCILEGEYLGGVGLLLIIAAGLVITVDLVLSKELLFYGDRVVKVWHLFGRRTIYYSQASVGHPGRYARWISSAYLIFESKEDGKPVPMRLPIMYHAFFFPSDTAWKIGAILDYLTQSKENNPRKFRKGALPKEVIGR